MKAIITQEQRTSRQPIRITEVELCLDSFDSHAERERSRKAIEYCFSVVWGQSKVVVVFENEEVSVETPCSGVSINHNAKLHPLDKFLTERARDYLLDNLEAPPNLAKICQIVGVSHPKLNRCFKQLFGMTVFQYLRQERLNQARRLLELDGRTVSETSFMIGYDSLSHFSQAYKKQFGISPSYSQKNCYSKE